MYVVFDSVILGRKSESIPANRKKNAVPLHTAFACNDIHCSIGARMTYMKPLPRRIREFDQGEILLLGSIFNCTEGFVVLPAFLPLLFNLCEIVLHF